LGPPPFSFSLRSLFFASHLFLRFLVSFFLILFFSFSFSFLFFFLA
jgi:hypothetical protein